MLSIIIVNWNVKDLLIKNLESIFKFTQNLDYEVIVVDNGSVDGSVEAINKKFSKEIAAAKLKILDTKKNNGFSRGNNIGYGISTGDYVLFMNPDMELVENSFKILADYLDNNSDVGAVGCTLIYSKGISICHYNPPLTPPREGNTDVSPPAEGDTNVPPPAEGDTNVPPPAEGARGRVSNALSGSIYSDSSLQKSVKNLPSLFSQIIILLKLHHILFWFGPVKKYLARNFDYTKEQEAGQLMGAFIMLRREVFEKIGKWDEDYWLFWEDVELAYQLKKNNIKTIYTPRAKVVHHESKCFEQQASLARQRSFNKGMLIYFKKHRPKSEYFILKLLQPWSLFLAILTQMFGIKMRQQSKV